jgi:hypothetical protein
MSFISRCRNGFYPGTYHAQLARYLQTHVIFLNVEFELGVGLDSAGVLGMLLYNGDEWGRVIFESLNS